MARNTSPANAAPRWPDARDGQGAPRHDQQPQQHYPQQAYQAGQPYPYRDAQQGFDPQGHDPYAGHQAHQPQQPAPYGYPADPYADQAGYPQQGHAQSQPPQPAHYAPQFEPYQPPQVAPDAAQPGWEQPQPQQWQPAEPAHYAPQAPAQPGEPLQHYGHAAYAHPEPQFSGGGYQPPQPAPQLRGATYDHTPGFDPAQAAYQPAQTAWPAQPGAPAVYPAAAEDPYQGQTHQSWDAGQGGAQQGYGQHYGYDPAQGYNPAYQDAGYAPAQPYGYGDNAAYADPSLNQHGYPPEPGFGPAEGSYAPPMLHAEQGFDEADYDPDEIAYEDDQPSGRSRLIKIAAAACVAVVAIGGGVYGYSTFMGSNTSGKPPVVRKAETPAKIKPDDPGGKKFAHTDSKVLGRLSEGGDKSDADTASDSDGGTRKVSTMVIGRDGSIVTTNPPTDRPPPSALPDSVSPVPGLTIVDGFGGRVPRVSSQPAPSAPAMVNAPRSGLGAPPPPAAAPEKPAAAAPSKPVVIARAEPETRSIEAPSITASEPAPVKRAARPAAAAPSASASSGAGYVAVLASVPRSGSSRIDALKQFADLQQKYAAQLGGKTPDVQEANLGEKGTYHRLIVGPPGSRQQASRLCSELKTAGYSSCWVKSY